MSEMATTYQDLIKEAFIDPIRTVTVIDDEYPTLLDFLQESDNKLNIDPENIERLLKITEMCHKNNKWSLDVFNGKLSKTGDEDYIPDHLNHSDLLILDYHLEGNENDDGESARKIIQHLDSNNHFNIILVHTKGVDSNIKSVYEEILCEICELDLEKFNLDSEKINSIEDWIDNNIETYDAFSRTQHSNIDLIKTFSHKDEKSIFNYKNPNHIFHIHAETLDSIKESLKSSDNVKFSISDLINFRLTELVNNCEIKTGKIRDDLSWGWNEDDSNYISTGKVFISVVKKSSDDPETELFNALQKSLINFDASPMHLLMAKIRHEIDDRGLEQAQGILSNRYAQAGWLYSLITNDNDSLAHDKAIDLHWEQLGRASKNSLRDFSRRLVSSLTEDNNKNIIKRFFNECIGNAELSCGHLNAFSCSMPVTGKHLNTGTVFSIGDEFWVCLTPACDLVPGQKIEQWSSRIGSDYLAFKAVQLHKGTNLSTANGKANNNEFIYLNLDSSAEPKVFSFSKGESQTWDIFYATNQGRFTEDNIVGLAQVREAEASETEVTLHIKKIEAKVIAELRYEYALNLLQRFGANQTRVGLDFIEKSSLW